MIAKSNIYLSNVPHLLRRLSTHLPLWETSLKVEEKYPAFDELCAVSYSLNLMYFSEPPPYVREILKVKNHALRVKPFTRLNPRGIKMGSDLGRPGPSYLLPTAATYTLTE